MAAVVHGSRRLLGRPSAATVTTRTTTTTRGCLPFLASSAPSSALSPRLPETGRINGSSQSSFFLRASSAAAAAGPATAARFSTAAVVRAKQTGQHIRAGKQTFRPKKKTRDFGRTRNPAPGERKAVRKRIVLSNSSALVVPGLTELTAEDLVAAPVDDGAAESAEPAESVVPTSAASSSTAVTTAPRVAALPDALVDQLRAVEAFKPTQSFPLFRRPSLLVRTETRALATQLRDAAATQSTLRLVIDGPRIAGKSILLLQAQTYAFLHGWVVISIPEARELTTACTEYSPLPDTEPTQYVQPVYTYKLLQAIQAANAAVLESTTTRQAYDHLPTPAAAAESAASAASAGGGDPADVPTVDPYDRRYDARVAAVLQTVRVLQLQGLSKAETRALMEYWAASGLLPARIDEQMVAATWTLAGNGLVGELERTTLLSLRS
ncbi:Ribosomal protein S23/S29, mitochondrial [Niveomyces insectorum RCEF 264]|uniref:Small ribosomal subunit protein mS29 n=1 Tax=Niveomyces insectorum RCEF 264 TaxID=1081102 RepID=A0A167UMF0_9HYPO|nr:Ribosomal protein S23/S29, mitochondrial [Niveomyces insectorum RCEF 264]